MLTIVTNPSILSISGIGSCIALAMRDDVTMASGLAHIVLPSSANANDGVTNPGRYSDTAVAALIRGLLRSGGSLSNIKSKLVGGARVLPSGGFDGARNVESTRNELKRAGVSIVAEDIGQTYGRSMKFNTATGKVVIRRFQQSTGGAELKDIVVI